MPTVLLLDVSLSMCRLAALTDASESQEIKQVAVHGLKTLLDYEAVNNRMEFTSLMLFSSLWEVRVGFARDLDSIKVALADLNCFDKTNILNGLSGVDQLVTEEWGNSLATQIILITDGTIGIQDKTDKSEWKVSFKFPFKLHIVCITNPAEETLDHSLSYLRKLIQAPDDSLEGQNGQIWLPEDNQLSLEAVEAMFKKLGEALYKPFRGTLHCGNFSSPITLCPPPENYVQVNDFETFRAEFSSDIHICGFLPIADVASPPVHSRHLVFSLPAPKEEATRSHNILTSTSPMESTNETEDTPAVDDGKQPSFCVLLHGSLKIESAVALCEIGAPNWYGMLYSWADSKKKSNLMLSTFHCGPQAVAWLGNFHLLGNPSLNIKLTPAELSKNKEKKSYTQNCVVWLKPNDINSDVQKVLRHARKLPEKLANFYKELNRIRRAALAMGFYELLHGLANVLERECHLSSFSPEAAIQITHAVASLRSSTPESYPNPIVPHGHLQQ